MLVLYSIFWNIALHLVDRLITLFYFLYLKSDLGPRGEGGWGVLTIVGYTGRLRPKGMPFLSSHYVKGGKIAILVYD